MKYRLLTPWEPREPWVLEGPEHPPPGCPDCGSVDMVSEIADSFDDRGTFGRFLVCCTSGCGYVWFRGSTPTEEYVDALIEECRG